MFFQVLAGCRYGREVDWWAVGLIMCDMMVGLDQHPRRYPSYLTKDAVSILRMVSSSALSVSMMGSLLTVLQQPWWAQIMYLDYKLAVLLLSVPDHESEMSTRSTRWHTFHPKASILSNAGLGTCATEACQTTNSSSETTEACQTTNSSSDSKVSMTGFVFNFCHKGLSLKLHVKAESNSLVRKHTSVNWRNLLCWPHWHPVARCWVFMGWIP
jgi:hypothetical protein